MSSKVLILHGLEGSDYPHWQSHLAIELIKNNYEVSFPVFPNKFAPKLDEWLEFLDMQMRCFDPDIVVCHSLANILWFHYLNRYDIKPIQKLMLVSPVSISCQIEQISTFFPYELPYDLKAKEQIMVTSDNDPYITIDEVYRLRDLLGSIGLKVLENAGHINEKSGYGRLDCAYDWVVR